VAGKAKEVTERQLMDMGLSEEQLARTRSPQPGTTSPSPGTSVTAEGLRPESCAL
jgi:hypothetical protein